MLQVIYNECGYIFLKTILLFNTVLKIIAAEEVFDANDVIVLVATYCIKLLITGGCPKY